MKRRNLRKMSQVAAAVQQQHLDQMESMAMQLGAEETGNFGVLYPNGSQTISQVRDMEREANRQFNNPLVKLPNPTAEPPFDRMEQQGRDAKNQAFGFQVQPDRLIDLPPGDAGAGKSVYRRTHVFSRLNSSAVDFAGPVAGNPFDKAIGMATYVSSDCRPRFWHISFLGIGVQRVANANALEPLTNNEILSQQLLPVTNNAVPTGRFVPAITQLKGRIMVFDESGQRFYDVDIMGNRSIDVYAWGVTAFILAPGNFYENVPQQSAYEVNVQNGGQAVPQTEFEGLVDDSIIGVRIVPIVINSTQNTENRTIAISTPDEDILTRVPIPPGTLKVQIICQEGALIAADYLIQFDAGTDGTFAGRSDLGIIDINPGQSRSDVVLVPSSSQILFDFVGAGVVTEVGWSIIFVVEAQ